jgi:hypothetical protein
MKLVIQNHVNEQEAFHLAELEQKMDVYAMAIEEQGTPAQFAQLAEYFANISNFTQAGHFHQLAGHHKQVPLIDQRRFSPRH